jgi:3-deoxy-7-phosphoheptulonate synthase
MENVLGVRAGESDLIDFFTAHEACTWGTNRRRRAGCRAARDYFDLTTHFPWVGLRTNHPDDAHVEFLRGIENPIGIKVGPESGREHVARWLETLDPRREPGRLTLIHRFGVKRIADALPPLVEAVRAEGGQVVWICDPMHGNTHATGSGVKTRNFEDIYGEVEQAFEIHAAMGHSLGGVHIEVTGRECDGVRGRIARPE